MPVVDLEAAIRKTTPQERTLVLGVPERLPKRRARQTFGVQLIHPRVELVQKRPREFLAQGETFVRAAPLFFGCTFDVVESGEKLDGTRCTLVTELERFVKAATDVHRASESSSRVDKCSPGAIGERDLAAVSFVVVALNEAFDRGQTGRFLPRSKSR